MRVNVDELRSQPQRRLCLAFKENLEGVQAVKPVVGELCLQADAVSVRVSGRVQTLLKLSCDRCLKPYFLALSLDLDERFVDSEADTSRERELNRDDFVELIPADGALDISDIVYQAVTLATPTFCLCGEECPGPPAADPSDRSAVAGDGCADRPLDPRWENLKTLFLNDDTAADS